MLTEKEQKLKSQAEQRLAMPAWKFVLLYGILLWGIPVGILVGLVKVAFGGNTFDLWLKKDLWINLVVFTLTGILFGFIVRGMVQRQLKKLRDKETSQ
jgi:hypothetical protein